MDIASLPGAGRASSWTRYWASGALHSCAGSFEGNYGGAIRAFWERVFDRVDGDARVLDIGCGNGPLGRLLAERAGADPARMPRLDAVDLAEVVLPWRSALPAAIAARVAVHPGVRAEALPFADASVDLVASQYGIEYADAPAAFAEVARVLAPAGRAAFVLHHADGLLVQVAREEARHLEALLEDGGLLDAITPMLGPMARAATPEGRAALRDDAAANAARQRLNAVLQGIERAIAASAVPDALLEARARMPALFSQAAMQGHEGAARALADWRVDLADGLLRQRELVACALDEAGVRAAVAPLLAGGRPLEVRAIAHADGRWLGWGVEVGARAAG